MASLSNINGLFDVHSTGAILFSTSHGTSGQILRSNGNAAPTWVAASTVIGGPYLPIAGGVLEGATSTDTGINFTVGGNLFVTGTSTLTGALSGAGATFTSDAGVTVYTVTTQAGAKITFSDEASSRSQKGFITYRHVDTQSYGSANSFIIDGDQATMTILADGKLMYKEGVYLKPATGTGAGTRKDNLWNAAYNDKITGLAVAGTTTKTLTATQQDGGTLTASWTDNDSGGTVTGTGANTQVAFWTGTSVIDGSSSLKWDNTNFRLGIGITPTYALDIYNSTGTTSSNDGTTLQRLWNYVGSDLQQQKTFIDFVFQDGNDNEYPQVRIGAEVGQNGNADTQLKEGSGAFVVYTNNATTSVPGTNSLTERMRVDYAGNVGIGTTSLTNSSGYNTLSISGTTGAQIAFQTSGVGKHYIYSTGTDFDIYNGQAGNLKLFTNSAERMRIDSVGYISTPADKRISVGAWDNSGLTSGAAFGFSVQSTTPGLFLTETDQTSRKGFVAMSGGGMYIGGSVDFFAIDVANGNRALTINDSLNVGIGVTGPGNKLTVATAQGTTFSDAFIGLKATSTINTTGRTAISLATSTVNNYGVTLNGIRQGSTSGEPRFGIKMHNNSAGGLEALSIRASGNIGIGTASPDYKLDVSSSDWVQARFNATSDGYAPASILLESVASSRGQGIYQYNSVSKNSWFSGVPYSTTSDDWVIAHKLETTAFNADVAQMSNALFCVNDNGNVGIGETSPSEKLEVAGRIKIISTGGAHLILNGDTNNSGDTGEQDAIIDFLGDGDPGLYGFRINSENYGGATAMNFQEYLNGSYSSRLYINKDGWTKIKNDGDTTWDGYNFHAITQSAASQPTLMIYNSASTGNQYGVNVIHTSTSANTTGRFFLGATNNGATEKIKIYTNGNIQNTNNSYTQLSDLSLKENVVDATDKLEEVKKLRVINWNFIGDDLKQIGVAAQEVEQIFPGLVDEVEHTQDGETSMVKSVKYSVFVPILIKAIQELETRVKELENK